MYAPVGSNLRIWQYRLEFQSAVWKAHLGPRNLCGTYRMNCFFSFLPVMVHHCLFGDARFKVTSHYNFKLQLKCNEDNIFFKKKKKKGKHSRKRNKKKVFHWGVTVLRLLYFSCLETPCQCATQTFFFFFLKAVNKLLFSTWWVFFHAGAVQIRWNKRCCLYLLFFFSMFFFLLFLSLFMLYEARWWELSCPGAFVPSEGEFFRFCFFNV